MTQLQQSNSRLTPTSQKVLKVGQIKNSLMIPHALVKGITDEEIREKVLAKTEEMEFEETVQFVEAKETGQRFRVQLSPSILASTGVSKITAYKKDQRSDILTKPMEIPDGGARCMFCSQTGYGYTSSKATRRSKGPVYGKICTKCQKEGHFAGACQSRKLKVDSITQSQQEVQFDT